MRDILPTGWFDLLDKDTTEIIVDLERPLEVRTGQTKYFCEGIRVANEHLKYIISRCGQFGVDNRAGIAGTLHRVSQILDRTRTCVGLTIRIGSAHVGCVDVIEDLIESGESILLVGPPAVGKTTLLRDVCRYASLTLDKAVVIVDTSNEIAGDASVPHEAVGGSRRLMVPIGEAQYRTMIEAVENHAPEIVVVDEVGNYDEALACMTIAQRGVQLIATAHGRVLHDILYNPDLKALLGDVDKSTLSDETVKDKGLTSKKVLERVSEPTFTIVVEILGHDKVVVHRNIADTVDALLKGEEIYPEVRTRLASGAIDKKTAKPVFNPVIGSPSILTKSQRYQRKSSEGRRPRRQWKR